MRGSFIRYSRKQFERELIRIRTSNYLLSWSEITQTFNQKHGEPESLEYIYSFPTKNRSVQILIFSSVDTRTGRNRDKDTDAVRVIYEWGTRKGLIYKKIRKHLRINTLFTNLERTVVLAFEQYDYCRNITGSGWRTFNEIKQ